MSQRFFKIIPVTLLFAVVPVRMVNTPAITHNSSGLVVPDKNKFIGIDRLSRSMYVRMYKGIFGKLLFLVEVLFSIYAWIFLTFGVFLSIFGLGFLFPPIINTDFIQNVFIQRTKSLVKSASIKLEESNDYTILFQNSKEIVIQWNDTKDVAYLKRILGIWRVIACLSEVQNLEKHQWTKNELELKNKVLHLKNVEAITFDNKDNKNESV